ncbi:hypothetical protein KHS38_13390 [Mucilaginibacter sp. Bleaf8]|uniref:hypothetical protein n=1 Tax=Mucilaginibacter sp. Bleaf8 TaxID=2834430 RepID=UPI001BD15C4E|nr:hypothetical protein [Mucilaginibacter sp. Bleaf8]MBS7565399.1 hypothetical protein [Mucilaginibacter sp. Bleaf8]
MPLNTNSVALIIIFNHRYDKNIAILEELYKDRFPDIYHLVPFYDGDKENVIPVYENSFYFQGYIAQGLKSFYRSHYTHYFFIADDMILNPQINAENLTSILNLSESSCFIPRLATMPEVPAHWPHNRNAVNFDPYKKGVEIAGQIPSANEAEQKIKSWNITNGSFSYEQVYGKNSFKSLTDIKKSLLNYLTYLSDKYINGSALNKTKYPLVRSYSDICIVSKDTIKKFCHYCGAFAATDLFVELALPTALALSSSDIRTEKDLPLKGRALWNKEDYMILDKYANNLNLLLADFPKEYLYLHPIKLSKWSYSK